MGVQLDVTLRHQSLQNQSLQLLQLQFQSNQPMHQSLQDQSILLSLQPLLQRPILVQWSIMTSTVPVMVQSVNSSVVPMILLFTVSVVKPVVSAARMVAVQWDYQPYHVQHLVKQRNKDGRMAVKKLSGGEALTCGAPVNPPTGGGGGGGGGGSPGGSSG